MHLGQDSFDNSYSYNLNRIDAGNMTIVLGHDFFLCEQRAPQSCTHVLTLIICLLWYGLGLEDSWKEVVSYLSTTENTFVRNQLLVYLSTTESTAFPEPVVSDNNPD